MDFDNSTSICNFCKNFQRSKFMICYDDQDSIPRNDWKFSLSLPLFNKCTAYKNPNGYTVVTLYNLLGFCLTTECTC